MSEVVADIASLKEQMRSAFRRIEVLEETVKMIPKIETLLEVTIETNKKQSDTLSNINTNLAKLNNNYDNLTNKIGTIETDIKTNRADSTININALAKDAIFKIIPSVMGGLILAWLYIQFGMK